MHVFAAVRQTLSVLQSFRSYLAQAVRCPDGTKLCNYRRIEAHRRRAHRGELVNLSEPTS
jgi:hypothetical protein